MKIISPSLEEYSLHGILKLLENKGIMLPLIQRPFVWKEPRIAKFMDSIVKKIPVGVILLYRHDGGFVFFGRPLLTELTESTMSEQYKFDERIDEGTLVILDGHQRLQTLLIAARGSYNGKSLYHNVTWRETQKLHECSFMLSKENKPVIKRDGKIWIQFKVLMKIIEEIMGIAHRRERLRRLKEEILEHHGIKQHLSENEVEDISEYIDDLGHIFIDPYYRRRIMSLQIVELVEEEGKLDQLLEIFVRFNSGGMRLSKSDLLFSVLKRKWRDVEMRINELSENVEIDKDLLLKALTVVSGEAPGTPIYEIVKRVDRLKSNFARFKDIVETFYFRLHNELTPIPRRILRKFNFLIPVIYFFFKNPNLLKTKSLTLLPEIIEYILIIVYNSRLRSDTYLRHLIEIIDKHGYESFPIDDLKRYLKYRGVKTELDGDSLNVDVPLTFSLITKENWSPLIYRRKIHVDHIFPKSRVGELPEVARPFIDSIWNKHVVFSGDNISKGDKLPEEYFVEDRKRLLKYYILPEDISLLKKENFHECLIWRIKVIKKMFKEKLGIDIVVDRDIEMLSPSS